MTKVPFDEAYKGVVLKCQPKALQGGGWAPRLVISDTRGGDRVSEAVIVLKGTPASCKTAREAAEVAFAFGKRMMDAGY